ncbi:hypothetical protein [Streptomyces sp. DG1A-41]|uniref:hypothetical protein n=1 Tax=Streptomyces sp. DG1A-41 TaxID=3125779 RepID=UPI0030D26D40
MLLPVSPKATLLLALCLLVGALASRFPLFLSDPLTLSLPLCFFLRLACSLFLSMLLCIEYLYRI